MAVRAKGGGLWGVTHSEKKLALNMKRAVTIYGDGPLNKQPPPPPPPFEGDFVNKCSQTNGPTHL